MKIAFWGGNAFWKTVEVALQKLLGGGGGEEAPWPLATSPSTYNKYPATWNLSDNPELQQFFGSFYHTDLTIWMWEV